MKILLIDDDPLSLGGLKMALEQRGEHQCLAFTDSTQALAAADKSRFDAVISDVRMPGLTGFEVLHRFRVRHPSVPVILMTGVHESESESAAIRQGAHCCFKKPLRIGQLLETLNRIHQRTGDFSTNQ